MLSALESTCVFNLILEINKKIENSNVWLEEISVLTFFLKLFLFRIPTEI